MTIPGERRAQVARATLESVSALTPQQAGQLYDRVGRAQDWQAIYEDRAVRKLTANAEMSSARAVFELGCGTGRLARRLLTQDVPNSCRYVGVDVSPRMVQLTRRRLEPWSQRAAATPVDGSLPLPGPDNSVDRFLSVFVFDLLRDDDARAVLAEARRLLSPDGLLCLASLTPGSSGAPALVSRAWTALWQRAPKVVGGCRPVHLLGLLGGEWDVSHRSIVPAIGLRIEIVVAAP